MHEESVREMAGKLSNWGKWGPEDEKGTLNYITKEKIIKASRVVRKGKVFSLSIPFERHGPQSAQTGRLNPILLMQADGADVAAGVQRGVGTLRIADDLIIMSPQCATHWDAFAHVFSEGLMYNGLSCKLVSSRGASRNSIVAVSKNIVSRGILLDLARYKQVDALGEGYTITTDDLEGCCDRQSVTIEPGDIVLLRTGHMKRFLAKKDWEGYDRVDKSPGLSWRGAPWFYEHQIAAVASDMFGLDAFQESQEEQYPLHLIFLVHMGLMIGEMWYLDELASDCGEDGVYEFLLVANPIPLKHAVGAPVNPTAIK